MGAPGEAFLSLFTLAQDSKQVPGVDANDIYKENVQHSLNNFALDYPNEGRYIMVLGGENGSE